MILRCTKRLLAVIGVDRLDPDPPGAQDSDWYANLLWCRRRKHLLLTHAATLFTAVQADISAAQLRSTHELVVNLIARELASEGLPSDTFGDLTGPPLRLATTADRRILGCMNDMATLWQAALMQDGPGIASTVELNRALRRNINSTRGYQRPIDLTIAYRQVQGRAPRN